MIQAKLTMLHCFVFPFLYILKIHDLRQSQLNAHIPMFIIFLNQKQFAVIAWSLIKLSYQDLEFFQAVISFARCDVGDMVPLTIVCTPMPLNCRIQALHNQLSGGLIIE